MKKFDKKIVLVILKDSLKKVFWFNDFFDNNQASLILLLVI